MASIVSSSIFLDNTQSDRRRVIIEEFIDDQGNNYQQSYMVDPDMDVNAKLAVDAANLNAQLQAQQDGD